MTDLPSTIRVGYRDYTVEWWSHTLATAKGNYAECDKYNALIKVSEGLDGVQTANVLIHEVLHACWDVAGLDGQEPEERAVNCVANVLCQVWRDNPDLMAFLDEKLKG